MHLAWLEREFLLLFSIGPAGLLRPDWADAMHRLLPASAREPRQLGCACVIIPSIRALRLGSTPLHTQILCVLQARLSHAAV